MANPFLSSEEYDERAHRYYDEGNYDAALDTLREALRLYPHSVELYVGLGYTRLAREEFVWAKQAFERALVLDPEHEDGLVGLGEALLRFGQRSEALGLFAQCRAIGGGDLDLLLTMGRALYRERLYTEAREVLEEAVEQYPDSAEACAALGYTLHRLSDETGGRRQLRRALHLDSGYHEARIYLGHLLYDRGDWAGAAREFERVPVCEHWDSLAVWRLIELKRALEGLQPGAPELGVWERRLEEVESAADPLDELLAEIEAGAQLPESEGAMERPLLGGTVAGAGLKGLPAVAADGDVEPHRVHLPDGGVIVGTWTDIVEALRQMRAPGEPVAQFMRRMADEARQRAGVTVPAEDPRSLVLAGAQAGFWEVEY
ncbi:MAG TPA: tetratricopeptide repeat protein [Longimicrobiales bacterium]|nr:tetratricopeptide repeat protein [Longimicrobiales bacterium]